MPRHTEAPKLKRADPIHGNTYTHPAYGTIAAHRINGSGFNLFQSSVDHMGVVRITVTGADLCRNLGRDWVHSNARPLVVLEMSESQWVAFISRMNMGSGTPCTLRYHPNGDQLVQVPELPSRDMEAELQQVADDAMAAHEEQLAEARAELRELFAPKLSAKGREQLERILERIDGLSANSRKFYREQIDEHAERASTNVRIELDAAVDAAVTKLGLGTAEQLGALLAAEPSQVLALLTGPKADDHE